MKKNTTKATLFYAGAVIVLFSLLAQLPLSRPDTGVISALWIVVATLFKLIPFVVGLVIGIAVCVAAVLSIYVASAYIVDRALGREACGRVKAAVRGQYASLLAFVAPGKFGPGNALALAGESACSVGAYGDASAQVKELPASAVCRKAEGAGGGADAGVSQVLDRLQTLDARLLAMENALRSLQDKAGSFVGADKFEALRSSLQGVEEGSRQSLEEKATQIQEQLEKLANQNAGLQPLSKSVEELGARFATLEQQQSALPKEVAGLREEYSGKISEFSQQLADLKEEVAEQLKSAQSKGKSGGGKKKGGAQ